jgi:hypothetical protein
MGKLQIEWQGQLLSRLQSMVKERRGRSCVGKLFNNQSIEEMNRC